MQLCKYNIGNIGDVYLLKMRNIIVVSFYNYIENRNTKFVVLTGLMISTDHFTMPDDETTDCVVDETMCLYFI